MKTLVLIACLAFLITSCHRKTVPETTRNSSPANSNKPVVKANEPVVKPSPGDVFANEPITRDSITTIITDKPLIIVDGKGNMITEDKLPPDASKDILKISSARAFTPAQTKNLAFRFKYIPPRILYVPVDLIKTSSRGTYYIYNKKFYYWKKQDGYFYLDENYYN